MPRKQKHIVIDARIRRASTGRPVDRLLEYLQSLDDSHRYTVLLEPGDDWKPRNKKFHVAVCKYRIFSFNPLQQLTYAWQLYRLQPDLVHFTMTGQQPLFYFGRQITFTHDLTMFKYARRGRLPKWLHSLRMRGYRLLIWQAHRKARRIIVPTEYVRDAVAKFHLFASRRLVVTLEASEPPIAAVSQQPLTVSQQPFILYVGSAFPHKNLQRLIKSFELLKNRLPDLQLVLTGKQEYHAKRLKRWAKKNPYSEDIIFTGYVADAELKWLYEQAGAYVFPSLSEGFGLPGLEAMTHGCPVVSSNATCLPEVYGEAAHYFNPLDTMDMSERIAEVLENKRLREKLVASGYQQIKKFSWKRMTEQTMAVYEAVLS